MTKLWLLGYEWKWSGPTGCTPKQNGLGLNWLIPTVWDADALSGAVTAILSIEAKAFSSHWLLLATRETDELLFKSACLGST